MREILCRSWWMIAVRGIVAILFGLLALNWPGLTLLGLLSLFAVYALLGGAISVTGAIRYRKMHDDWWLPLLLGITAIGAAVLAVIHPALTLTVLVLLIGANALISGILDIMMAIHLRKTMRNEWLLVLSGAASIVFGVLVFLFPGAGALAIVWMISVYSLATGILLLALSFRLRSTATGRIIRVETERRVLPDRRMAAAH